ncbi:MAG: UDP-2,3-diacylglucosamine diphosphatase [Deltaproteobacteria bacterium]|nr:UDP-2,3-diacylglucosamine diphosphatase [Deltaproteobacteria bacterium]
MTHAAYFISDAHLGAKAPDAEEREARLIAFFENITHKAGQLFIMGDLFDFWIEYTHAIRPDYFHVLYELRRLKKQGVEIHYLAGNHDFALGAFLSEKLGVVVHPSGWMNLTLQGKTIFLSHGDGLMPSDHGYRVLKKILRNTLCQKIYRLLHPNWGVPLAEMFSRTSRDQINFRSRESERNAYRRVAKDKLKEGPDIVVFGHTHYPEMRSWNGKIYCNTGDWIQHFTYAVLENGEIHLKKFGLDDQKFDVLPFPPD